MNFQDVYEVFGAEDIRNILIDASKKENITELKKLLRNVQLSEDDLNYALENAAYYGNENYVRFLLEKGATEFTSPLAIAAENGHINTVNILLNNVIDDYDPAVVYASGSGHYEIVQLLIERGAENLDQALVAAAHIGDNEIVQLLIDNGANYLNDALAAAEMFKQHSTADMLRMLGAYSTPMNEDYAQMILSLYY